MKKIAYALSALVVACNIGLIALAPDKLSMVIIAAMLGLIVIGMILGIMPAITYMDGFEKGMQSLHRIVKEGENSIWVTILDDANIFKQKTLDNIFENYQEKISQQRQTGQILSDIDDYMNEDILSLHSWHGLIIQIPGTLTGLGILGTFVGLITGINGIGFSSVDAAIDSVQTVLNGIHIAFFTSIAGIALSIVFNIVQKITWNMMTRQLGLFVNDFHTLVIPTTDEQLQYREKQNMKQILERLDRIPKTPAFTLGAGNTMSTNEVIQNNESILMPQILKGIRDKEFTFILQPKYDIHSRKIVAAEAFVRWMHPKLGTISPAVFLPAVEENGFITKLDNYIWESVFEEIHAWIEEGLPTVPIAINISKTDILAGDISQTLKMLAEKYNVPPRMIEAEISGSAFTEISEVTNEAAAELRKNGFKVIRDGFDGNLLNILAEEKFNADELKLDLRRYDSGKCKTVIENVYETTKGISQEVTVEGIESMEQVAILRKAGCIHGQGFYFSKPVPKEEFVEMIKK